MRTSTHSTHRTQRPFDDGLGEIRNHVASAMIGKTVSLIAGAGTIARGMVAGVLLETGTTKIVVNGRSYDLNQILSVCPAQLN